MADVISLATLQKIKGIGNKTMEEVKKVLQQEKEPLQVDFPKKKYNVIYADPPWAYDESGTGNRVVHSKYPTMSLNDLKRLPVQDISDDDCLLFLWVTFPRLEEGLEVINAWGFRYYGLFKTWIKTNKKSDSLFWGMGYYSRQNPEILLIGLKGKIPPKVRDEHSVLISKVREHSRKPDEVRDQIVRVTGDLPRIELFARQQTEGWDVWGNEIGKFEKENDKISLF